MTLSHCSTCCTYTETDRAGACTKCRTPKTAREFYPTTPNEDPPRMPRERKP